MNVRAVIIEAGGANFGSLLAACARIGVDAQLSDSPTSIRNATHVILPGVGAAAPGMQRLRETGLIEVVRGLRQPVLGVCLGMQLLCERSEEGDTPCLGIVPTTVRKFDAPGLRVPHMGWNALTVAREHPLLAGLGAEAYAYFVHSYHAPVGDWTLASTDYAGPFSAIVQKDNFYGMQFHPERSASVGARLLANFLGL